MRTVPDETPIRRSSVLHVLRQLLPWLAPYRGLMLGAGVCTALLTLLFQAEPLLIRHAVDHDMTQRDLPGLYRTVLLFVVAQGLAFGLGYLQRMLLETAGQGALQGLKERLFAHTLSLSLSYFDKTPVGRLMSRLEGDAESLHQLLSFTGVILVGDSCSILVSLIVMISVSPALSLVTIAILVTLIMLSLTFSRVGTPIFRRTRERVAEVSAFLQERLGAVLILQAYRREIDTAAAMDRLNQARFQAVMRGNLLWNGYFNILMLAETGGLAVTLMFGGHLLAQGRVTVGTLLMFTEYLRRFFIPVYRLSEQLNVVQRAFVAGERVFDMLAETPRIQDPPQPNTWSGMQTGIEFCEVGFSYRQDEPVLKDVSFVIPQGERWAVVGATGSGKSTLINLMLRFYDVDTGAIKFDGIDIRTMRQQDLRRRVALVLQNIVVFPGTLRDNLSLGDATVDVVRMESAARATRLEHFIASQPDGYDTVLAERGANLSTGQLQLLSFARALVRNPDILILDEATAAVDPETERFIQSALETLLEGRTALIVAHRLATVRHAHRILVMDAGRIVEQGTHHELLAADGPYRRLYRLQMAGADEEVMV